MDQTIIFSNEFVENQIIQTCKNKPLKIVPTNEDKAFKVTMELYAIKSHPNLFRPKRCMVTLESQYRVSLVPLTCQMCRLQHYTKLHTYKYALKNTRGGTAAKS